MTTAIDGRSFLRGELTRDEILAVTAQFESSRYLFQDHMSDWAYDVILVQGDLEIDGRLEMFNRKLAGLVVTGNLVVRGYYGDGDDPESGVFVLGDMAAENVVTSGWLNVAGSLT